jgi:hypothetical protein
MTTNPTPGIAYGIMGMKRSFLLDNLALVERHIRDGERHLLRQREIAAELERHGRGHSQTAKMARDILESFEMAQSAHLNDRVHLLQALRAITKIRNGEPPFPAALVLTRSGAIRPLVTPRCRYQARTRK